LIIVALAKETSACIYGIGEVPECFYSRLFEEVIAFNSGLLMLQAKPAGAEFVVARPSQLPN
jgi:hypothetical protein